MSTLSSYAIVNVRTKVMLVVLKALAHEDENVAARIARIATSYLSEVEPEDVAFALYDELNALEVGEVWDRAGSTRHGYVEPGEAADQMIEETIDPYLEELKKYQALGMNVQANQMCKGLLLGLYKFERESTSEFKSWAPDVPVAFAEEVVSIWREEEPTCADIKALRAFVEDKLCGWETRLV
jgi:hypothetical protein